ncbi:MAG: exodeoxyribonuclease subunit alpha [Pseudomonadota bacterium]|jgi:exodeoxyribonuclease V alpha subunit
MPVTITLRHEAFARRVGPLVEDGTLTPSDVHVVDRLAAASGETDPDVMLALAFATRAPRHGHTGVNLHTLAHETLPGPMPRESSPGFAWPTDVDAWATAVRCSNLVTDATRTDGETAPQPPGEVRPFRYEHGMLQTARMAAYEERLSRMLRQRATPVDEADIDIPRLRHDVADLFAPADCPPHATTPPLTIDMQVLAATMAVLSRTTVISGGPGTGKTTTIRKVLVALYEQARARGGQPPRVALAAPTGKAAARMGESLAHLPHGASRPARGISDDAWRWLTALVPTTLHRMLGWQAHAPSRFRHHPGNPLPFDVVVVDEASMVDVALMCKLVEAVADRSRLILLGDRNQLVSVDAGSALADVTTGAGRQGIRLPADAVRRMEAILGPGAASAHADPTAPSLASCMVHFTRAFRFESEALRTPIYALADATADAAEPAREQAHLDRAAAALLRCTQEDLPPPRDDRPVPSGPIVRHRTHAAGGRRLADAVLDDIVEGYAWILRPLRHDTTEATRRQVVDRVDGLRVLAAHRHGPLGVEALNRAVGSALAHRLEVPPSERGAGWWTGRMVLVTENDCAHDLWNGDIGVVVQTPERTEVVFPGRGRDAPTRSVGTASMPAHETAFAMTIHKSQGSQFDHAVVVLPDSTSTLLTRELIYTGISRAKARLTLCGSPDILQDALRTRVRRATSLHRRLWGPTGG